jgi:hypothetical protein
MVRLTEDFLADVIVQIITLWQYTFCSILLAHKHICVLPEQICFFFAANICNEYY